MNQSIGIIITLCHQFKSKYYNSKALKSCIRSAIQDAEDSLTNVNMAFEDIEEAVHDQQVHANVTKAIRKSHMVVFEISDLNHNVMYELGIANTLGKPIIIIREKSSDKELPADINQFIYLEYDKGNLDELTVNITKKLTKLYHSIDEIKHIPRKIQEKVITHFMKNEPEYIFESLNKGNLVKPLHTKEEFQVAFEEILASTKKNFYYIGTMGFLASGDKWFDLYSNYFDEKKVFSRIVYLKSLKEFYAIYEDEEMLINYCMWLSQNYYFLEKKIISLSLSSDVGIWKNGMSLVVSDEQKLLISAGQFRASYHNKGVIINNAGISHIFKEYAKILAEKSKHITAHGIIKYFSFNTEIKQLPEEIYAALQSKNFGKVKEACTSYVFKCLDE